MRSHILLLGLCLALAAGMALWLWSPAVPDLREMPEAGAAGEVAGGEMASSRPTNHSEAPDSRPAAAAPWVEDATGSVLGLVLYRDQSPVAEAQVTLFEPGMENRSGRWQVASARVTAGEEGRFEIPGLPAARTYRGVVQVPGFAPLTVSLTVGRLARIVLDGSASITGRVSQAPGGEPVAAVRLVLEIEGRLPPWAQVESDEQGRFQFRRLPAGMTPTLWAVRPGCAPYEQPITTLQPQAYWLDLLLPPTTPYRAVVLDAETRLPVPGATVSVRSAVEAARTDRDGTFTLELPRDRLTELTVGAPGYVPVTWQAGANVPALDTIVLLRGGSIDGAVYDSQGQPLAGVLLTVEPVFRGDLALRAANAAPHLARLTPGTQVADLLRWISAESDAYGSFRLQGIGNSQGLTRVRVRAMLPGYCTALSTPLDLDLGTGSVETRICLRRASLLTGRVLVAGVPPDAEVRVRSGEHAVTVFTDAAGRYRIDGLPPGNLTLQAFLVQRPWVHGEAAATVPEELPVQVDVPLLLVEGRIRGRVVDARHQGVAGARVVVRSESTATPELREAITKADGSWWVLVAGDLRTPYRATVTHALASGTLAGLRPEAGEVRVTLGPASGR